MMNENITMIEVQVLCALVHESIVFQFAFYIQARKKRGGWGGL